MAIKTRGIADGNFNCVMSMEEFKRWLKRFDANNDGSMSKEELRDATRVTSGWFSGWKSSNVVHTVDANSDGFIDKNEINNIVDFAVKHLSVKIVAF